MEQVEIDQLNRLIAIAREINKSADQLLTMALYLRERASDIGEDDRRMLDRCVTRIEENVGYLR